MCIVKIELDFNEIIEAEAGIPLTVRQGLLFIAGYVTRKLPNLSNQLEEEDTTDEYLVRSVDGTTKLRWSVDP